MDTVWIRLTVVVAADPINGVKASEQEEYFMFGPTGITKFSPVDKTSTKSALYMGRQHVANVAEDGEFIMGLLRKIRRTEALLGNKTKRKKKKAGSKGKT